MDDKRPADDDDRDDDRGGYNHCIYTYIAFLYKYII